MGRAGLRAALKGVTDENVDLLEKEDLDLKFFTEVNDKQLESIELKTLLGLRSLPHQSGPLEMTHCVSETDQEPFYRARRYEC